MKNSLPGYTSIRLQDPVAERFRAFSRKTSPSHSATINLILDYFQNNGISPKEDPGPGMRSLEERVKKRINYVIALLKNMEKTQTKPVLAMLELLFQQEPAEKDQIRLEKKRKRPTDPGGHSELEEQNLLLKSMLIEQDRHVRDLLDRVQLNPSGLGQEKLRLEMSHEDFLSLKTKLIQKS